MRIDTLTYRVCDFVNAFPGLTATALSHRMYEREKLSSISSILNRLIKKRILFRIKETNRNKAWIYYDYKPR